MAAREIMCREYSRAVWYGTCSVGKFCRRASFRVLRSWSVWHRLASERRSLETFLAPFPRQGAAFMLWSTAVWSKGILP
jgi:hypothetical protein